MEGFGGLGVQEFRVLRFGLVWSLFRTVRSVQRRAAHRLPLLRRRMGATRSVEAKEEFAEGFGDNNNNIQTSYSINSNTIE